jgi:rRNA-processing protein FCF1
MVVFDSDFLLAALDAKASLPRDPKTGKAIGKARERVEHLIDTLSSSRTRMLIPAPVLAEVLVNAGSAVGDYIKNLRAVTAMQVGDFDMRAAVECAQLVGAAIKSGAKRSKSVADQPWQKVKIDRQIVAIAKVHGAKTIYTCDEGLSALARDEGLQVLHVADLPVPPVKDQPDMFEETKR